MGAETTCDVTFKGKKTAGRARLETASLDFRGASLQLTIPLNEITRVTARDGRLTVTFGRSAATFDLGTAAPKWAEKIQHPPTRLAKIGVKPDWTASVIGVDDDAFVQELRQQVARLSLGKALKDSDAIFLGASNESELSQIDRLKPALKSNGALWVIRPKGRPEISEAAVMAAGKKAGLVDVKVVSFSATHTAEKFVIPLKNRSAI